MTQIISQLNINISASTYLTRLVIPKMIIREGKSAIITVGSISSDLYMENLAIYSATKAFLSTFSEHIGREYSGKIDCICLKPSGIQTNMSPKWHLWMITPEASVR